MEHEYFRKKVYMNAISSTLIHHDQKLMPQWVSQNQINYLSAYDFAAYNIEQESSQIIGREQGQNEVLLCQFKPQMNESNSDAYYLWQSGHNYHLSHLSGPKKKEILLYQNDTHNQQYMVYDFLDYLMMSEGEQQQVSSRSIAQRTQKLIEEMKQQQAKEDLMNKVQQMEKINQMEIVLDGTFGIFSVEMKSKSGIMLVNINKCYKEHPDDFGCPIRPMSLHREVPQLTIEEKEASRIIYIFTNKVIQIKRTKDITQLVILTESHLLLLKINYELMELFLIHKIPFSRKETISSIGIISSREEQYVVALTDTPKKVGSKRSIPSFLRMFLIQNKKLSEIRKNKKEEETESHIRFQDQIYNEKSNVKFSCKVLCSQYEIEEAEEKKEEQAGKDLCGGVLMAIFSKMMNQDQNSQKQLLQSKQKLYRENGETIQSKKTFNKFPSLIFKDSLQKENISGFVANQDLIFFWEKTDPIIHIYKLLSKKQQEQKHRTDKEDDFSTESLKHQKEEEIKNVYTQLMGITPQKTENTIAFFEPKLEYFTRIDVGLIQQKIWNLVPSPSNSNILIFSGTENKESMSFNIFQLDLFRQLGNQEPSIFLKPIKNIHKSKSVDLITTSLVKEQTLFLSGKLIHNFENEILDGAISYDIHPYNYFLAVSFGFATKVFAFEGNQKLTSLFTVNGQGMKQVKYSPLGNHLCILTSKAIKIVDAYSFSTKFILHEKLNNFTKCFFSSNGLQFYTVNDSHQFNFYNTFDYTKLDNFKGLQHHNDFKPVAIKSFLKIAQYCFVLQNGGLYIRYKSEAVVISQEQSCYYEDGEKISCIEIDEKNGVLFVGCKSGKMRAHTWPLKEQSAFECFSEVRIGFSSISSLALSNISPLLYVGTQSGNISKLKYRIDRDKGIDIEKDHNLLLTDKNFRYLSIQGSCLTQRMYRYVLTNGSTLSSQQVPEKARLQFKLSEVIQKLNQQMKKLKSNIKIQLQQKEKLSLEKVDFGLLHHMNQMITTKLCKQLREEVELNKKETHEMGDLCREELQGIMLEHSQLVKAKSFETYENAKQRNQLKNKLAKQLQKMKEEQQRQMKELLQKNHYVQTMSKEGEQQLFFLPNDHIEEYTSEKRLLDKQLEAQKQKHYELRKACAYKETAIKQMFAKKIKQETLQFKIGLQRSEMQRKLNYNKDIVSDLKSQIQESEKKVHQIQAQAFIIKNNAQYKRIASVEEMIDACSYKIWMKNKLEEEQISELNKYLKAIDQIMESKCQEVIDLLAEKDSHQEKVKEVERFLEERKKEFNFIKINVLSSRHRLKQLDIMSLYKSKHNGRKRGQPQPRLSSKIGESVDQSRCLSKEKLKRVQSTRTMLKMKEDVPIYHKLMEKQTNFLKTNVKIHQRKMKKMGKENGKLLYQFQKLQLQKKYLIERQMTTINSLEKLQHQQILEKTVRQEGCNVKPQLQLGKTSFQKYIELKTQRNKGTPKYKTACSTPCNGVTPLGSEDRWFKIQK